MKLFFTPSSYQSSNSSLFVFWQLVTLTSIYHAIQFDQAINKLYVNVLDLAIDWFSKHVRHQNIYLNLRKMITLPQDYFVLLQTVLPFFLDPFWYISWYREIYDPWYASQWTHYLHRTDNVKIANTVSNCFVSRYSWTYKVRFACEKNR